jgi:ribosome-associated translation inhibitor RaiA
MQVEVRALRVRVTGRFRERIQRRAYSRLSRFGGHIHRVAIRLSDENGPRRGVDRVCQVITTLPGVAPLVIEDRDARLTLAADHALRRTARHLARHLRRQAARSSADRRNPGRSGVSAASDVAPMGTLAEDPNDDRHRPHSR